MDDISSISIHENDNINKQIIELVSKLINNYSSTTQDPAYLLFTGKTNDNSQNLIVFYILVSNNRNSTRTTQIFNTINKVNLSFNKVPQQFLIPVVANNKEISLKVKGEIINISTSNIGLKSGNLRKLKISDISHYQYDANTNTYIIVNAKYISDVIDVTIKGLVGNSVDLESDFQIQLYLTFPFRNKNYDYEFVNGGINIKTDDLLSLLENITKLPNSINGIEIRKLKDDVNLEEFKKSIELYMSQPFYDDIVFLDFNSENDDLVQNLIVQLNFWKNIPLSEQDLSKPIYVVSESIVSDINNYIKNKRSNLILSILTNSIDELNTILDSIHIPDISLQRPHKLYFSLLSFGKNQISSGDLYIVIPPKNDSIDNLNEYIIVDNNIIYVDNNFDEYFLPNSYVIPLSYKKLSGQRYGKFTLKNINSNNNNQIDTEIKNIVSKYIKTFKQLSTIPKSTINKIKMSIEQKIDENFNVNVIINQILNDLKMFSEFNREELVKTFDIELDEIEELSEYKINVIQNKIKLLLKTLINLQYNVYRLQQKLKTYKFESKILRERKNNYKTKTGLLKLLEEVATTLDTFTNIKKVLNKIDELQDTIIKAIILTIHQMLFVYSLNDILILTELILEMINRSLKLNVIEQFDDVIIVFSNSYYITSNIESDSYELPYLFKGKEFHYSKYNKFITENNGFFKIETTIKLISMLLIKTIIENNEIEDIDISNLTNTRMITFDKLLEISSNFDEIVNELITTDDDISENKEIILDTIDKLLDNLKISNTNEYSVEINIGNEKSIYFEYQYRYFGTSITSEQTDIKIK